MDVVVTNDTVNTGTSPPVVTKKVDTNLFLSDGDIAVVGGIQLIPCPKIMLESLY